jgi:hypothetical protein
VTTATLDIAAAAYSLGRTSANAPEMSNGSGADVVGSQPTYMEGVMKFIALIYNDESMYADATPQDIAATFQAHGEFGQAASEAGVFQGVGDGLQPVATATTVRVREGERLLTDGPYAETKEQLGGFYALECKDLDEALAWAARIPEAKTGAIEVRPLMDYEAMDSSRNGAEATAS